MSSSGYDLALYGRMMTDWLRMGAYSEALRAAIKPGAVVVDIGAGSGIMAILACKYGASRVYAIEPDPVIQVAREVASANGYAGRIDFLESFSTDAIPPKRADVVVSDLRGCLPLFQRHIPSIMDARQRLLAPGGALIGQMDEIWAAVVEAPVEYGKIVEPWDADRWGTDFTPAKRRVLNRLSTLEATQQHLLTPPCLWATLDYRTIQNSDVCGPLRFSAKRKGIGHGIVLWFDAQLAPGIRFSTGPGAPYTVYGRRFLPWLEPVPLAPGQQICVEVEARLVGDEYLWRWVTEVQPSAESRGASRRFEQCDLHGAVLSPAQVRKAASVFVPQLSTEGAILRRALQLMDGTASLEDISKKLVSEFPERFGTWRQALSLVGSISQENSR